MTDLQVQPIEGLSSPETEIRDVNGTDIVFYAGEMIVQVGRKKSLDSLWCKPEPGYTYGRCKMITRQGQRCKNGVRAGWPVCHYHGAGHPGKPGGRPPTKFAKHLPHRLMEQYEDFLSDPDIVSVRSEMALVDTRVSELLEKLETAATDRAWSKVHQSLHVLRGIKEKDDNVLDAEGFLEEAIDEKRGEEKAWDSILKLIESRRKLSDTERRRIVDAQHYLDINQASALVAFLVDTVKTHVQDPDTIAAISDQLKRLSAGRRPEL